MHDRKAFIGLYLLHTSGQTKYTAQLRDIVHMKRSISKSPISILEKKSLPEVNFLLSVKGTVVFQMMCERKNTNEKS